jgi:hypothetical protein
MGVKATHRDYDKFAPKWQRMRDIIAGQDAMHAAGERYLPKLKAEDDKEYQARVKRSDFFNGTWRTIDALGGMVFRKPPTVEVPKAIEPFLADVTLSGMSMEAFAKEVTEEVLGPGRIGILVDHPPSQTDEDGKVVPITRAVAEQRGVRPTLQLYAAESVRNWKFSRIKNAWMLSQVVLGEKHEQPKDGDEFETECVDRYRVLDLGGAGGTYRQRVFEVKNDKDVQIGGDIVPLMNGAPLDFIPFKVAGTGGANDAIDEPPLIDLADKNVAHYQVNSDYRHGGHFTALPTLFLSGIGQDESGAAPKILIGGSAAITSPHPEAKGEYIEFQGQGLGALEKMLDRLEKQMALLGARMIADESTQAETLGATQIKRAGENSVLAKIVTSVSESLEWALGVFAKWAGHEAEIAYQLNRDFLPAMMDAQQLNALFAGVTSGNISKRELFELLQRGDVIDGEKQYEEHQREIDEEAPTLAPPKPKPGDPEQVAA